MSGSVFEKWRLFLLQIFSFMFAVECLVTLYNQNYLFQSDTETYWSDICSQILVNWNSELLFISWLYHYSVVFMVLFIFSGGKTIRTAAISEVWVVFASTPLSKFVGRWEINRSVVDSKESLWHELQKVWGNISVEVLRKYIDSAGETRCCAQSNCCKFHEQYGMK